MDNQLYFKPNYSAHRRALTVADPTDLAALLTSHERGAFNAKGHNSIQGHVRCGAGDITLQVLELVKFQETDNTEVSRFIVRGSNIGPLSDGQGFEIDTPGGGQYFLRAHAVTTGPVDIFIAGGLRANEGSI